jgi:hypothetical protein
MDAFSTVPAHYFEPGFSLRKGAPGGGLHQLISAGPLEASQDLLAAHLDSVECQLLGIVKSRTRQVFATLTNLHALEEAVKAAAARAASLHEHVACVRDTVVLGPLCVIAGARRARRQAKVLALLRRLSELCGCADDVQRLVEVGDLAGALALLAQTREALAEQQLRSISATAQLLARLERMEAAIADTLVQRYATSAIALAASGPRIVSEEERREDHEREEAAALALAAGGGADGRSTAAGATATADDEIIAHLPSARSRSPSVDAPAAVHARAGSGGALSVGESVRMTLEGFIAGDSALRLASGYGYSSTGGRMPLLPVTESEAVERSLQRLRPTLEGLVSTGRLQEALVAFQAAAARELRIVVKQNVAESVRQEELASGVSPNPNASAGGYDTPNDAAAAPVTSSSQSTAAANAAAAAAASTLVTPDQLASLTPDGFLGVLRSLTTCLSSVLTRTHALHSLTETVLDLHASRKAAVQDPRSATAVASSAASSAAPDGLRALSASAFAATVDAAQQHVVKLMSLRRDQSARLKVPQLKSLWEAGAAFAAAATAFKVQAEVSASVSPAAQADGAGAVDGATPGSAALAAAMAASGGIVAGGAAVSAAEAAQPVSPVLEECFVHVKAMLRQQHARNLTSLIAILDAEQWRQADVPYQVQAVADAVSASVVFSSGSSLVQTAAAATDGVVVTASAEETAAPGSAGGPLSPPPMEARKTLTVKGQSFFLVGSGVILVKMLGDYSSLSEAVPDVAADIIGCTVELLRTFNARATQLVLGAGALQSANLKRITAKHLALAAQTLGAVLALLPSVRASLIMRLPPRQHVLLSELARVTSDFMQHEQRIFAKFVIIVRDLLQKCCNVDMRTIRWGDAAFSFEPPSAPIKELVKGITTLHSILQGVLRREQLVDIFVRICAMIGAQLPLQYASLLVFMTDATLQPTVGSAAAGSKTAVAHAVIPFSRDVANERLSADIRFLLDGLRDVLGAMGALAGVPISPAREGTSAAGNDASNDVKAAVQGALATLHTLSLWSQRQFSGSVAPLVAADPAASVTDDDISVSSPVLAATSAADATLTLPVVPVHIESDVQDTAPAPPTAAAIAPAAVEDALSAVTATPSLAESEGAPVGSEDAPSSPALGATESDAAMEVPTDGSAI